MSPQKTLRHQDVSTRVAELKRLEDGWLDGRGRAPSHEGLDWLAEYFASVYPESLPLPYLYPVAEGGVQLEWSLPPEEISLEVDFDTLIGEWHALDLETDEQELKTLPLADRSSWKWVVDRIAKSIEGR